MRKINYIVVHCSATREGHVLTPEALESTTGYHYYIRRDGTVLGTRSLELPGAHCRGHNKYSIGICYEGGLDARGNPKDTRTPEQRSALHLLVYQLLQQFRNARVCGHRDLSPDLDGDGKVEPWEWVKQCPCFEVKNFRTIIFKTWNYENKQRNLERYLENCGYHHCHHSQCAGRAGDATVKTVLQN